MAPAPAGLPMPQPVAPPVGYAGGMAAHGAGAASAQASQYAAVLAADAQLARKVDPENLKRVWENLEAATRTYHERELPEEVVQLMCRVTAVAERRPQTKPWVTNLIMRQTRLGS
eukprot:tig00001215_g7573.t1